MKFLIDSSAWIEYLEGSESGEKVNEILKEKDNEIFVIDIIVGEVVSKTKRAKKNFELSYKVIVSNSKLFSVTPRVAKEAGILHAEWKSKNPRFSLADAFIIKSAESISAKIVAKDPHFKNFKNVVMI